jgi:outer membrane immunogenic protein
MGDEMMNCKIFGTALAAFGFLASSFSAQAADIPRPVYKGVHPVVAYYNWTGFYVGVNGGYGWGSSDWSAVPTASNKPKGFLAGGTLGYNYQTGSIVWGIEGDFDWSNIKDEVTCAPGVLCGTQLNWLTTLRGRLGYAFDRWLPYITGGAAYGNVEATLNVPAFGFTASSSNNQLGWTAGVGIEYAFLSNWSAKIEYLYVDLGSFNAAPAPLVNNVSFTSNIVRAGLNYKFSGPIFSRY